MSRAPMSMEAALDEERLEVIALLEGIAQQQKKTPMSSMAERHRSSSPATNPRSPVRSMLDVSDVPRHASIAGTHAGSITNSTRPGPIRSMLDIDSPVPLKATRSAQTSPTETSPRASLSSISHPRSNSDASLKPSTFGPRASLDRSGKVDPTSSYQFSGYLPSNPGVAAAPKRNTLAGKTPSPAPSSMSDAVRGELGAYPGGSARHSSAGGSGLGIHGTKSRSPHNRLGLRSNSPHTGNLSSNSSNVQNNAGMFPLDNGMVVDMSSAYRRLSDANLALGGGSLAVLSRKGRKRGDSGNASSLSAPRLEKDYSFAEGDETAGDSSDERSSDEEGGRGRKKDTRVQVDENPESQTLSMGRAKGPRQARSLMAAAEEERQQIAQAQKHIVRSLLEPEITITGPSGGTIKTPKVGVHPSTAFDHSGVNSPMESDEDADITDIKRAQKMAVIMTPISSTPASGRCVRTIFRGDFAKMQQEAEDDQRRVRKYLVATDLSDEAAHALEWTVGTVLRDGDTLLAIYCVDEETGIGEGHAAGHDPVTSAQVESIAATTNSIQATDMPGNKVIAAPSPLAKLAGSTNSPTPSPMGRGRSRAEQERYHAVQDITDRVSKLLRKTRLQVRVVIEVIHCKSPRHLITEVIDTIEPTLVILGSRGRSALKGVILGSFSNYLVTKSSVPVMVARKRLRKHTKYKRPAIKLANNLTNVSGKSLASAKID